jgi:hypothetical protein
MPRYRLSSICLFKVWIAFVAPSLGISATTLQERVDRILEAQNPYAVFGRTSSQLQFGIEDDFDREFMALSEGESQAQERPELKGQLALAKKKLFEALLRSQITRRIEKPKMRAS